VVRICKRQAPCRCVAVDGVPAVLGLHAGVVTMDWLLVEADAVGK